MINNEDIVKYRNIKAPSELRTRVLRACELEERKQKANQSSRYFANPRFIRGMSAVAACLVLVMLSFVAVRMVSVDALLTYNGNEVSEEIEMGMVAMGAKSVTSISGIPLNVETNGKTTVVVSGGNLYVADSEGNAVNCGDELEISKNTDIWWDVSGENEKCFLTVSTKNETTEYILEFKDDTPNGVLYKNK